MSVRGSLGSGRPIELADLLDHVVEATPLRRGEKAMRNASEVDVRHLLGRIDVPTLALHRTGDVTVRVEHARHLAESISAARLIEFPGTSHWPWIGRDASDVALAGIAQHIRESRSFDRSALESASDAGLSPRSGR